MNAAQCTHCLAGDLSIVCEETACPFLPLEKQAGTEPRPETHTVGEVIHELTDWEQERLRREHDSLYCIAYGGVLLLAALFAALFLTVAGVWWGGD